MTQTMYLVCPPDSATAPFLLRYLNDQGKLTLREEYQDLACARCRKVDEAAALTRGISTEVVVRAKRPSLFSQDDFYLVDDRAKKVLAEILTEDLDFIQVPSGRFWVASPRKGIQPHPSDPGFQFVSGRCTLCQRPREVVWGKELPTLPGPCNFAAVNLESVMGARWIWLVSQAIADSLKGVAKQLTGMALGPREVRYSAIGDAK
jgi:hypothetical protein